LERDGNISSEAPSGRPRPMRRKPPDLHEEAMVAAEVSALVAELNSFGPMPTRALSERCHAQQWRTGTLEQAIGAGVRQGRLRRLPCDFVDVTRPLASAAGSERRNHPPTSSPAGPVDSRAPDGLREAGPLLLMVLMIAIPVGLVALAAAGAGTVVLVFAILAMVFICAGLARVLSAVLRDDHSARG
jgi:hypothetical protein